MKTIQNPDMKHIGPALLPAVAVFIGGVIMRRMETWMWTVALLSVILYLGLLTYYCIKQRCYSQLARTSIVLIAVTIALAYFMSQITRLAAQLASMQ